MMRDNNLSKKRQNRYLIQRRLKPVTVCIAAICNINVPNQPELRPTIVFCADRLVSAGIQFESGEPKIKRITDYCYVMQSSNDSLVSDLILEKVCQKASLLEKPVKIEEIVKIIRNECIAYRKEWTEDAILQKYNMAFEEFDVTPESIVSKAIEEVEDCEYPYVFQFIVLGIEPSFEAHLYVVEQDGRYRLYDSLGFAAIGNGGELAFLEMTKYGYSRNMPAILAIPKVYIAKKVSERAQGVGRYTDLAVLVFANKKGDPFTPAIQALSTPEFIKKMEETYQTLMDSELKILNSLPKIVFEMLAPKPQPEPSQPNQA
jgi:hypothetical protein